MMNGSITMAVGNRRWVWAGLALAVLLDTVTQMVWKLAVIRLPSGTSFAGNFARFIAAPIFVLLVLLFLFQFFNWMVVLGKSDVSYAQPITALSYITVAALSTFYFGERFSLLRGGGIGLILAGVWLIGTTPIRTAGRPARRWRSVTGAKP